MRLGPSTPPFSCAEFPTANTVLGLPAEASHRFETVDRLRAGSTFHCEPFQRMIREGPTAKRFVPEDAATPKNLPPWGDGLGTGILVAAIAAEGRNESARDAAVRIVGEHGRELGRAARRPKEDGPTGRRWSLDAAREILARFGFEPVERDEGTITLRSCPYDQLARGAPDVVCTINHAFVDGVVGGLGVRSIEASLEPTEGACCVRVRASG